MVNVQSSINGSSVETALVQPTFWATKHTYGYQIHSANLFLDSSPVFVSQNLLRSIFGVICLRVQRQNHPPHTSRVSMREDFLHLGKLWIIIRAVNTETHHSHPQQLQLSVRAERFFDLQDESRRQEA